MTTKKEMPYDFWNHDIHPILGYKYIQPSLNPKPIKRDIYEYPEEDNYNPNTEQYG